MSDEEAEEYREILRVNLPALKKAFGATHFHVTYLMNQAYREEEPNPHFHWHIIPRYQQSVNFAGQTFQDPDFGNSFEFNRKQYLAGEFQKQAIETSRNHLDIVYFNLN